MWLSVLVVLLRCLLPTAQSSEQLPPSPCPSVFSYEGRTAERDRWYGVVLVTTDAPLTGLRLDVKLSRPAHIMGNWEGEVTTSDNQRFTILNLEKKIVPGPPISVRIFVKFSENREIPVVDTIALNGRQICPLQANIYHKTPDADRPWRPSELETGLEPAEPVEIDSGYQASLSQSFRPNELSSSWKTTTDYSAYNDERPGGGYESGRQPATRRPSGGYDTDIDSGRQPPTRRPSGGYDSDIDSGRQPATRRPSGGYDTDIDTGRQPPTRRPSGGYDSDIDSGRQPPTRRPSGGYDSDIDSGRQPATRRPSGGSDSDIDSGRQPATRRPSGGYDSDIDSGRQPATRRPSGGYDSDIDSGKQPPTRRPSGGYDSDIDSGRQPPTRRPSGGYDSDIDSGRQPPTRRPSGGYDSDIDSGRQPPTRRPSGGYDSDIDSGRQPATRRPSGGYDSDIDSGRQPPTRRPSGGYDSDIDSGRQPPTRRPSGGYDSDIDSGRQPPTRRPSGGYDSDIDSGRQPPTRHPSSGYDSHIDTGGQPSTRQPSVGYDGEFKNPSTKKTGGNEYQTSSTTRRSGGEVQNSTRRPNNNYGSDEVKIPSTTRRPSGNDDSSNNGGTRRPTSQSTGDRPPDRDVEWFDASTGRPDREDSTPDVSDGRCGQISISATPLVTHGQSTARGQWPWHAALYRAKGINLTYICGGTLVSSSAVVTAAHCVTKMIGNWPLDPDNLVVYLGKYHLKLWSEGGVQNRQVAEVHVHPEYNSSDFRSDVAVLTLSSPVDYTQFVRPVCLWGEDSTDLRDVEGREGYVVGWGFDEESRVTEQLMMARMPIVSQQSCLWSYPEFFSHFTNNKTYCAGFNNGTSVCNGDSGGGMVLPEQQADGSTVWRLRGLVSISVSKEEKRVCDTKHYVVFTDLAKYRDWIQNYLK
ncbi:uncharacterized protein [Anabrus simplex]|uniref:uncharacterized protein isoform X2 n=1 Tax=Anabrus simplex TaxID=316456 RepID=UPI0035A2BC78